MDRGGMLDEIRAALSHASVPEIRRRTAHLWLELGDRPDELFDILLQLWHRSPGDGGREVRMGIALLLGAVGTRSGAALDVLATACADDPDWRVQEALAKGLDWHCALRGWQECLPLLQGWLTHRHPNVRKAAADPERTASVIRQGPTASARRMSVSAEIRTPTERAAFQVTVRAVVAERPGRAPPPVLAGQPAPGPHREMIIGGGAGARPRGTPEETRCSPRRSPASSSTGTSPSRAAPAQARA